ncbi:MAG: capsule biosynthesis protein CapM [Gemmatimonadetes bacterium]|nr:capsule biosynthesis protein CapM [Gemmatimonadota bacterium]
MSERTRERESPGAIRLVHVVTVPQSLGFLDGQPRYMAERGIETTAVSSAGPYQQPFAANEPVEVVTVEMPRRITPFRDLVAIARLVALIRRIRPHIVHAHTPKGGLLGMIAAWIARTPVRVYHMRGLPAMTATGMRRRLLTWSERIACALADRVICVSPSLRRYAVEHGLCPETKIVTLLGGSGNGVDALGRFHPDLPPGDTAARRNALRAALDISDEALVVGFVGRLVRDKGVVELAEAWRGLSARFPGAHLLIAGPFEPQDPIPADTRRYLETDPRIHLMGQTDETRTIYAAAEVIVLPTHREGMPNVPLEAAGMGLPVVATDIPGCVDAVRDGVTGTLVPPRDALALGSAIAAYLSDGALRARHGAAGRERVLREFAREEIWRAIYAEYCALLMMKGCRVPVAERSRVHIEPQCVSRELV